MGQATPQVRELAQMLLASEAAAAAGYDQWPTAADRAWGRLRAHLTRLVGLEGFRALLSRSLALAGVARPWLGAACVAPDGSLQGVEETAAEPGGDMDTEAHAAVLAQFIGLLVLFVGSDLTRRLLGDIWPEVMLGNALSGLEGETGE